MWADMSVRAALIEAAKMQDPGDRMARTCALGALQNLSASIGESSSMWEDEQSREALLEAARLSGTADRKARVGPAMRVSITVFSMAKDGALHLAQGGATPLEQSRHTHYSAPLR